MSLMIASEWQHFMVALEAAVVHQQKWCPSCRCPVLRYLSFSNLVPCLRVCCSSTATYSNAHREKLQQLENMRHAGENLCDCFISCFDFFCTSAGEKVATPTVLEKTVASPECHKHQCKYSQGCDDVMHTIAVTINEAYRGRWAPKLNETSIEKYT